MCLIFILKNTRPERQRRGDGEDGIEAPQGGAENEHFPYPRGHGQRRLQHTKALPLLMVGSTGTSKRDEGVTNPVAQPGGSRGP